MNQCEDDLDRDVLRSIHADVTVPDEVLHRVRARLLEAVPASGSTSRGHHWGRDIAAAAAFAVGLAGVILVPTLMTSGVPTTQQPLDAPLLGAAAFTDAAARAVLVAAPLRPSPGQYRLVVSDDVNDTGVAVEFGGKGETGATYWLRVRMRTSTYVPRDAGQEWVRTTETWFEPLDQAARSYLATHPAFRTHVVAPTERAAYGAFPPSADQVDGPGWTNPTRDFLKTLPRDPSALLAAARTWDGQTADPMRQLVRLAKPLGVSWLDDPALRAAIFRAIGLIPGVEVSTGVTVGADTGTALRVASSQDSGLFAEAVFDPQDYHLIGLRELSRQGGSIRTSRSSYTTQIVSTAP